MKRWIFGMTMLLVLFQGNMLVSANFSADTTVLDGFYTDSDYDGFADDVVAYVSVDVLWGYYGMSMDVYVGLTLPSGNEIWYVITLTVYTDYFILKLQFLDSATESGWYSVHAAAFAPQDTYATMHSYTFDPPGGSPNNPPSLLVTVI